MLQDLIRETIEHAITAAQTAAQLPAFEMPAVEIMRPKQAEHGDYSTNVAMVVASAIRKTTGQKSNPRQIAQAIVDHIPADNLLDNVDLAGPGFINLRLADSWLQVQVNAMIEAGDSFGNLTVGQGKRWQVEYVSANPTGPIHYGGARNAVLGDGLANVLEAAGYEIQREFYVNDAGNQFGLFAESLYARYAQRLGQDAPFPEEGYQGEYMFDYAQTVIDEHGEHFMSQSKEAVIEQFKVMGRAIVLEALKEELAQIGVEFDRWYSEQSLYDENL
ncbi:MAG: arginine--tRNA ligase, partial [Chloroflexota bacterium]